MIPCAAILLGGQGTRLRSVTGSKPKALALVGGRPFVYHLLDQLNEAGIKLVVLCTGFGAAAIQEELGDWYRDIKLLYSEESKPLGTAGALRHAMPYFNTPAVLVLNGDSFCKNRLAEYMRWYGSKTMEAGMITVKVQDPHRFGQVNLSATQQVVAFGSESSNAESAYINAGIYLLCQNLIREIPENKFSSLESDFFPLWAKTGRLWAYPIKSAFIDIGTPESLEQAQTFFGAPAAA